ncbi:MAG: P-II family nitrogen regulator [Thermodesulfovibrionales bacterium]|jgi:nitrogen regulatory protein P-II 1
MKLVNAMVRTTSLDRIAKSLETVGISHFSVLEIKGIGEQVQLFAPYTIHKMIQIIIPDEKVNQVTGVILDSAHTGLAGDGLIAVLPVDYTMNIQTREKEE